MASVFGHALVGFTLSNVLDKGKAKVLLNVVFEKKNRVLFFVTLFLSTNSHAMLDAMTIGGLGAGFFISFENTRYFFEWRPIQVSPIGIERFFLNRD